MFDMRLKELRKKNNLTQSEFAKQFNVSNGAVGNWESGKRIPDSETLIRIADFFNVTVDYILGRTEDSNNNDLDKQLDGVDFALWGEVHDLTDEEKQDIINFVKFTKSKRNN